METYFASFGEVLELALIMNPKTNRHNGRGYIILSPTVNQNKIFGTKHIVRGVRIDVYECGSSDEEEEKKKEEEEEHISVR
ncbi:unnamed protein product [Dibothriocephalus latus]|uniref:RRM domain-containing protein n=1 Tax=Dibothriocephalus latus TaxID=60516 RepID=A0A3P6RL94_DIBLA|nr:unnamed protein product [Dibothriocephalus latus]